MADTYYEVEQGITRLIRREVIYQAPTKDFAELLAKPRDNHIMFLPGQTRHMFANGEDGTVAFVIEQPPAVRHVTWPNGARHQSYDLAIPWTYFIITVKRIDPDNINSTLTMAGWGIYCSKERVMKLTDKVRAMPINNVEASGRICFGTATAERGENIGQHIDNLILNFWNANFNYDHTPVLPGYTDYKAWEKDTKTNPACWLNWPWADQGIWPAREYELKALVKTTEDRLTPAPALDPIPDLPQAPTFGRAVEWLRTLTPTQIERLKQGLTAL